VVLHKRFARYTTRRKQGGSQSAHDAKKGTTAKSAGANLRRAGELHREGRGDRPVRGAPAGASRCGACARSSGGGAAGGLSLRLTSTRKVSGTISLLPENLAGTTCATRGARAAGSLEGAKRWEAGRSCGDGAVPAAPPRPHSAAASYRCGSESAVNTAARRSNRARPPGSLPAASDDQGHANSQASAAVRPVKPVKTPCAGARPARPP
jgi:hypothetical protein